MVRSLDETEQQTAWEEPQLNHQVRHWTKKVRQPIDIDNTRWDTPSSILSLKTKSWTRTWAGQSIHLTATRIISPRLASTNR